MENLKPVFIRAVADANGKKVQMLVPLSSISYLEPIGNNVYKIYFKQNEAVNGYAETTLPPTHMDVFGQ